MSIVEQSFPEKKPVFGQSERAPKYISREKLVELDKEISEQYASLLKKLAE